MKFLKKEQVPTMTPDARVNALHRALKTIHEENIEGCFVECGIWRGGNIIIAKTFFNSVGDNRDVIAYDTFEGMTAPGEFDGDKAHRKWKTIEGWARASYDDVVHNLSEFDIQESDVKLIKGDVRETLLDESNLPEKIAILRLDTDFYESTLVELQALYSRVVDGGYIIIDDYGDYQGCRKAVDEFFGEEYVKKNFTHIDYSAIVARK